MVSITLAVPEDIKHEMDAFPEMNWSEVARQAIKRKLSMLEKFKEFTKDSTLTQEEALDLGRKVSENAMKRHKAR
ncbi:MAG: hypothetical protein Q7J54_00440 [Candidatus Woesearchaeota archaeon]|nr:hypothetical protein [Candidatus Woesearchaeota archaeon]